MDDSARFLDRHFGRQIDVELDEIARAAGAGAQIMEIAELRVARGEGDEALALVVGPFTVEQLVDRLARPAPGTPGEPQGDAEPEQRIGLRQAGILVERQRADHREVEQQVGLVMDTVRPDRDAAGVADDVALPGEEDEGGHDGDERDTDALARRCGAGFASKLRDGAIADARRRDGDQHHLDDRRQSFGLAVPEAMLAVGRLRRDPHPGQGGEAGNEVERRIGEAAEHRGRIRPGDRPAFQRRQEQRHSDRGIGGTAGQPRALGEHIHHGVASFTGRAAYCSNRRPLAA